MKPLLPWKVISVRSVCMSVWACAFLCASARVRGFVHARTCSLDYPACNAYAPCCDVICGLLRLHIILRLYLINGTIFGKKLFNIKCVF